MLADRVRMGGVTGFYDPTPGPKKLLGGDISAGFFGETSATELISGDGLAIAISLSDGVSQFSTAGWLKFSWQGKVQFLAKKTFRWGIGWDEIEAVNAVYGEAGDATITINGLTFKVRLIKGADGKFDPKTPIKGQVGGGNGYDGIVCHNSEWNSLILPLHERSIDKSWKYPTNVENDIPIWEHNFGTGIQGRYTDEDLQTHNSYGGGSLSWCQEISEITTYRLCRGYDGVSCSASIKSDLSYSHYGWRPVLELVY